MRAPALTLALLLSFASTALADETSHRKAVENLMSAMQMESSIKTGIKKMLEMQLQASPQLAPFKDTVREFFEKYLSWSALKPHYVKMYMEAFSEAEIRDMVTYFNTPTGKKAAAKLPELGVKGAALGAAVMKEHMDDLMRLLREAAENQNPNSPKPSAKTYSREEFRKMVMGKSPDELLSAVGRPDTTQDHTDWQNWFYKNTSYDPITGKVDMFTNVVIRGGKVTDVSF